MIEKQTAAMTDVVSRGMGCASSFASSTASRPKRVVNLMIGFIATLLVSLNGSPTVSPTTQASCSGEPFSLSSTSTIFLALSQAPPAFAMNMAWKRPKRAMEIR